MLEKLRKKLLGFINSDTDVPLLAGFSVGLYMLLFYYAKNFNLVNSWQQLLFFVGYYIILPMVIFYTVYKLLIATKLSVYKKHFLFVSIIVAFSFFLLQIISGGLFKKTLLFIFIFFASILLSIKFSKHYKIFIILLFIMSFLNLGSFYDIFKTSLTADKEWQSQPDDIEKIVFKQRPNIYYIQPDGYTNSDNLKNELYNFDNSNFEEFLTSKDFTIYNDFRSNYYSTLLSNASMFSMKHHYIQKDIDTYGARRVIVGENSVLTILKNNNYKTHLLTEKPYLLMNRPKLGYDFCNINYTEIPFIKDGMNINKDISKDLQMLISKNSTSGNFYFIEQFKPSHIAVYRKERGEKVIQEEREKYLIGLQEANTKLIETINYIEKKDSNSVIIIGADHGGFVGFQYTFESHVKTTDKNLINSIFGSTLFIKWNNTDFRRYDTNLKTSVNLFRTVFSFLSEDTKYLKNFQDNGSYIQLENPNGIYRYIDDSGNIVFQKQ